MDRIASLYLLDDVAREELATVLEGMARDASALMSHALLPISVELLHNRQRTCAGAAEALRETLT